MVDYRSEENELLINAYKALEKIIKLHRSQGGYEGYIVQVNGKDFVDDKNPEYAQKYVMAFRSLLKKGLLTQEGLIRYALSPEGDRAVHDLLKEPS